MSEGSVLTEPVAPADKPKPELCDACGRVPALGALLVHELPEELESIVAANASRRDDLAQLCPGCVDLFSRAQRQLDTQAAIFEQNSYVLPTPLRLDADERFTGKGVTIAFLDSGFYAHPDLATPVNRIQAFTASLTRPTIRRHWKRSMSPVGTA